MKTSRNIMVLSTLSELSKLNELTLSSNNKVIFNWDDKYWKDEYFIEIPFHSCKIFSLDFFSLTSFLEVSFWFCSKEFGFESPAQSKILYLSSNWTSKFFNYKKWSPFTFGTQCRTCIDANFVKLQTKLCLKFSN